MDVSADGYTLPKLQAPLIFLVANGSESRSRTRWLIGSLRSYTDKRGCGGWWLFAPCGFVVATPGNRGNPPWKSLHKTVRVAAGREGCWVGLTAWFKPARTRTKVSGKT